MQCHYLNRELRSLQHVLLLDGIRPRCDVQFCLLLLRQMRDHVIMRVIAITADRVRPVTGKWKCHEPCSEIRQGLSAREREK